MATAPAIRYRALKPRRKQKPGVRHVADRSMKPFRKAFLNAARAAREALGNTHESLTEVGFILGKILESHLSRLILETMAAGATSTAARARKIGRFANVLRFSKKGPLSDLRFDITNPRAVAWARTHSSQLIKDIDEQTRKSIQRIIARSFEQGIPIDKAARSIRPLIGLNERQTDAVFNLRETILDNPGGKVWAGSRAIRVPDDIDDDWLEGKLTDYADRLIAQRADMIARTEAISSANYGQQELWLQAEEEGLLRGTEAREWIATPDERVCPICESLGTGGPGGGGKLASLDGQFEDDDGNLYDGPPAHPNCRCSQGLSLQQLEERAAGGPGSGNFGHSGRPGEIGGSGEGSGVVLHGTSKKNLAGILEKGLKPGSKASAVHPQSKLASQRGLVFLTPSEESAEMYAFEATEKFGGDAVILEIQIPDSEKGNLKADPLAPEDSAFKGTIKPEWIAGVRMISGTKTSKVWSPPDSNFVREWRKGDPKDAPTWESKVAVWKSYPVSKFRKSSSFVALADSTFYIPLLLPEDEVLEEFVAAGGPGSGNFGHSGRPGEVGGSGGGTESGQKGGGAPKAKIVGKAGRKERASLERVNSVVSSISFPKGAATGLKGIQVVSNLDSPSDVKSGLTVAGMYDSWGPHAGYIRINSRDVDNANEVVHEIGHHVHMTKLTNKDADEWEKLSNEGKNCRVSAYGRTNTGEHFAEAFQEYGRGGKARDRLLKREPKTHKFMERLWKSPKWGPKPSEKTMQHRYDPKKYDLMTKLEEALW